MSNTTRNDQRPTSPESPRAPSQPTDAALAADAAIATGDPASLPIEQKPVAAPNGIAGRADDAEREDQVTLASDESFPASDPPAY